MNYKLKTGAMGWLLLRMTGVALYLFLIIHLFSTNSPVMMGYITGTITKTVLLALLIIHLVNGVRIIIIEMGWFSKSHKKLFFGLTITGIALFALSLQWV